jgi:[CysO sulfur-carrier protein]-S-L-cysteine hydrolase
MFCIEKKYIDEMVSHARQEMPNECCGVLTGKVGGVIKLFRTTNSEHSPIRYSIEPNELIKIYQEMDAQGWDLLGIYHSHINHEAYPSPVDIKYAYFPQSFYIIISLIDSTQPVVRAFNIIKGGITEQEIEIIENTGLERPG